MNKPVIIRTTTAHPGFQLLVKQLDNELWNELKEDQAQYDQFNKVPDIKTAVLVQVNNQSVGCGCFKPFNADTIEIKRMFVEKKFRGQGLSKLILHELELWANENQYAKAILETSVYFKTAINLYQSNGYSVIPNYPPYTGIADSVCMEKNLIKIGAL